MLNVQYVRKAEGGGFECRLWDLQNDITLTRNSPAELKVATRWIMTELDQPGRTIPAFNAELLRLDQLFADVEREDDQRTDFSPGGITQLPLSRSIAEAEAKGKLPAQTKGGDVIERITFREVDGGWTQVRTKKRSYQIIRRSEDVYDWYLLTGILAVAHGTATTLGDAIDQCSAHRAARIARRNEQRHSVASVPPGYAEATIGGVKALVQMNTASSALIADVVRSAELEPVSMPETDHATSH